MNPQKIFYFSSLLICAPLAMAQSGSDADSTQMEEITVVGTSLSRALALEEKQADSRLIEALGTDELGQFPDRNVGESLNRLPGVSMLVEKGEGRFVQIRGINPALNNVTINGASLGSPEQEGGGRSAPMDVISGGILGGVQVVKTPTPDMDAQGIGGTVNVQTSMPFDRAENFYGHVTMRAGFESVEPEDEAYAGTDPKGLDALISGKTEDGRFGWLVGGSWSDREYVATGIYQDDWNPDNGLPVNIKNNYYLIGRERTNLNAALEFRPDEASSYYVRAFSAAWDEYQHRNRYEQGFEEDILALTANSGTSGENVIASNVRLEEAHKDLFSLALGGENIFDRYSLSYMLQRNENDLSEPNDYWEFRSGDDFGPNSWVLGGDGVVSITPDVSSADRQDASLIPLRRVRFFERDMKEETTIAQMDLRWDRDATTFFKAGLKYSNTDRELDESQDRYNPGVLDLTLGTDPEFTNGVFTNHIGSNSAPNIWMDIEGMNAFFNNPANADYFESDPDDDFVSDNSADYRVTESITAAYIMGGKTMDKLEILGGLRVEQTDIDSRGNLLDDSSVTSVKDGGSYTTLIPSLIANYRMDNNLVLRAGITRAIGRPGFGDIAPRSTLSDDGGPTASINIGNPDLNPRISWNYDLSLEWYPNRLSILSASIFYKDITDELVGTTDSITDQSQMDAELASRGLSGVVDTSSLTRLDLSTTVNGGSASLQGLELLAQTQFAYLPAPFDALGASFSATFLDGETKLPSGTIPLVGQPERTLAYSLFYQKGPVDASISYAYNDSFLTDQNSDPDLVLDQGEFGRWDAKVSYSLRDNIKIFIEGVNLNNEPTSEFQGGRDTWNTEYEYVGRTYYLGASIGF